MQTKQKCTWNKIQQFPVRASGWRGIKYTTQERDHVQTSDNKVLRAEEYADLTLCLWREENSNKTEQKFCPTVQSIL